VTTRIVVIICSFFYGLMVSAPAQGKILNPVEVNECVYSYWEQRVKSGLIDAKAATETAKAALYPSITGNVAGQEDLLAQPSTGVNTGANIDLTQQIVNFSQWANIHAKKISEKAAQLDLEDQLLTLMRAATKSYFDYLQGESRLKLLQKRVSRLVKAVDLAKELSRLRLNDSSAIFLAQADKVQLDISIANLQTDTVALLTSLQAAIGFSTGSLELDDSYTPQANGDLSYWTKKIDELPAIEVLKVRAEAAGATATSTRDQIIPSLSFSTYFGQVPASEGINPGGGSALVLLNLSVPIFDQGIRSIQTQQAESQKSVNEALVSSKREQLLAEIKNLLNQWQANENILNLAKDQLDNAQRGYSDVFTLFTFGKASFVAVKNSEASLVEAEIQLETVRKKIAEEKTILELLGGYFRGRHQSVAKNLKCPR